MYYIGKQFDTFEAVVGRLLEEETGVRIGQLNCISGRSFGFCMGNDRRHWFIPRIDLKRAAERISAELSITIRHRKIHCAEDIAALSAKRMVLGGITRGVSAPEFCSYYYIGSQYLYLWKTGTESYSICDPRGLPEQRLDADGLERLLNGNSCEVVYCEQNQKIIQLPKAEDILKKGMAYRKQTAEQEERDILQVLDQYKRQRSEWLSLQYGIMNLMQHLDGVFCLADTCGIIEEQTEQAYIKWKNELFRQIQGQNLRQIPQILKVIWRLIEHGLEQGLDRASASAKPTEHAFLFVPCGKGTGKCSRITRKSGQFYTGRICSKSKPVAGQQPCRID